MQWMTETEVGLISRSSELSVQPGAIESSVQGYRPQERANRCSVSRVQYHFRGRKGSGNKRIAGDAFIVPNAFPARSYLKERRAQKNHR